MKTSEIIFTDRNALGKFCDKNRKNGARIVFTNGVFDLFHTGHLDSLRRARAEGDVLVVGVNTDESTRRLKGEGRPVMPLDQRLKVLAGLEFVSAVAPFDEDDPMELIRVVKPSVLVKGGDYSVPQIVGHEFVQNLGGRVLTLPIIAGRSSTGLIKRVADQFATRSSS